jgi:hypothetical protein
MGANGNWNGPMPAGSNVKLTRSFASGDRDWRSTSVLPLRIVMFSGVLINNVSELNWKVENEVDVDHYNVERSVDGVVFEFIGAVKSKNRVSVSYDYPDDVKSVTSTRIYYRLRRSTGTEKNSTQTWSGSRERLSRS